MPDSPTWGGLQGLQGVQGRLAVDMVDLVSSFEGGNSAEDSPRRASKTSQVTCKDEGQRLGANRAEVCSWVSGVEGSFLK